MMENEMTQIRRTDRAITDAAWIAAFLGKADYGVFATCKHGQPFTVARNFVYAPKEHVIYFHGARKGRTFENVGDGTPVNLNASEMGEWIVADRAMNFGVRYRSVRVRHLSNVKIDQMSIVLASQICYTERRSRQPSKLSCTLAENRMR